jgi:hypothetical protein
VRETEGCGLEKMRYKVRYCPRVERGHKLAQLGRLVADACLGVIVAKMTFSGDDGSVGRATHGRLPKTDTVVHTTLLCFDNLVVTPSYKYKRWPTHSPTYGNHPLR